jgi:hypothetical protein
MAGLSPERLATLQACVDDGWPIIQITRTHRASWETMRRHFPDYRGMDNREAAKLGAATRKLTLKRRARP